MRSRLLVMISGYLHFATSRQAPLRSLCVPLHKPGNRSGAGADVKLLVDISEMAADGAFADAEKIGDLLRLQSARDLLKDFPLARRERVEFLPGAAVLLKSLHHEARDLAGHGRTTRVRFSDGFEQPGRRNRFDQ